MIAAKTKEIFIIVLLSVLPIAFLSPSKLKFIPIVLLMMIGGGLLLCCRDARTALKRIWMIVAIVFIQIIYAAINVLLHHLGWSAFDMPSQILIFLIIAAVFTRSFDERWMYIGFSLTTIFFGGLSLYQHYGLGINRVHGLRDGTWVAIEFAMCLFSLTLLSVLRLFSSRSSWTDRCIHMTAVILGFIAAILTQSRGPLLAFLFVLVFILVIHGIHRGHGLKNLFISLSVVAVMGAAVMSLDNSVQKRFNTIPTAVMSYFKKGDANGSIGERLEMWRTAIHGIIENPVLGVGRGQFYVYSREQITLGKTSSSIAQYQYVHNQFLNAAVTGGVIGLVIMVLLMGIPVVYFWKYAFHEEERIRLSALGGLAVCAMYILCGITDVVFYRAPPHSLYFFLVLGLAAFIAAHKKDEYCVES